VDFNSLLIHSFSVKSV